MQESTVHIEEEGVETKVSTTCQLQEAKSSGKKDTS